MRNIPLRQVRAVIAVCEEGSFTRAAERDNATQSGISQHVAAVERKLGRLPQLLTADAGYYSQAQEQAVQQKGVKWVAVPNRSTRSRERKQMEKSRWFKKAQRWRTGCEGRISVAKRRHGLRRCLYRGMDGMKRWVGLGVIADNLINIGRALAIAHP